MYFDDDKAINGQMTANTSLTNNLQNLQINHHHIHQAPHKQQQHHNASINAHSTSSQSQHYGHLTSSQDATKEKKPKNWKLIVDPAIKKGEAKVIRFEGVVPGVCLN